MFSVILEIGVNRRANVAFLVSLATQFKEINNPFRIIIIPHL